MRIRGDAIDIEHIAAVVDSPGYKLILDRLLSRREGLYRELLTADSMEKVTRLQGGIHEIDMMLATPKTLADEIRKQKS